MKIAEISTKVVYDFIPLVERACVVAILFSPKPGLPAWMLYLWLAHVCMRRCQCVVDALFMGWLLNLFVQQK